MLLTSIQIDVVEMVIAISKNYAVFQELKKLLIKLNNPDRITRINDKLCCLSEDDDGLLAYRLNDGFHREYDKPYLTDDFCFEWGKSNNSHRHNDMADLIYVNGNRCWYDKYGYHHRDNNLPCIMYRNGIQEWRNNTHQKNLSIYPNGNRYIYYDNCYDKLKTICLYIN